MKRAMPGLIIMLLLAGAVRVSAEEPKVLQGEVIDPAVYLKDGRHGAELEDLIYDAVDGGQTLALLEDGTGMVYMLLAREAGEDPNELLYEYVGKKVKITGQVYERGGLKGVVVTAADPLEPIANAPSVTKEADTE